MPLEHGGNVTAAAMRFGVPIEQWLDISTGISPWSWPVPAVPSSVWHSLPYPDKQLEQAASNCYGCAPEAVLAVPGSQYALQSIPSLLPKGSVAMPQQGYAEHRLAWEKAGHDLVDYADAAALEVLVNTASVRYAVVINPCNPTGELFSRRLLERLQQQLQFNKGYLVIDEAFADTKPQSSMACHCPLPGLIVFRSVGKFFGLAGLRLGFMLAPPELHRRLALTMPPWILSHPARWIGQAALSDTQWHALQCERLRSTAERWLEILRELIPALSFVGTDFFTTGQGDPVYADALYQAMGRRGLLVRLFDEVEGHRLLRFGLPESAAHEQIVCLIRDAVEECACVIV